MHVAYGDHQVSQYLGGGRGADDRRQGAPPALDLPARSGQEPLLRDPGIPSYPFDGSAIVIWDYGPGLDAPPPPLTNTPPTDAHDPHGDPRSTVAARTQMSDFLDANGTVTDVCGGQPCHTDVFTP